MKSETQKQAPSLQVFQIPVLNDNYIYILHEASSRQTAAVDPAISRPVNDFLKEKGFSLNFIFNTHHHPDHTGGNQELKERWGCQVFGFKGDGFRIPTIDKPLEPEEVFYFGPLQVRVLFVPGHTLGHIAFYFPASRRLFCGDTLFSMGCGRLFEGDPEMMFKSLQKIKSLPAETLIYCAHEYTEQNARFALSVDKNNRELQKRVRKIKNLRAQNKAAVPFFLKEDLKTNPFLRAETAAEFKRLREKKDSFQ